MRSRTVADCDVIHVRLIYVNKARQIALSQMVEVDQCRGLTLLIYKPSWAQAGEIKQQVIQVLIFMSPWRLDCTKYIFYDI